ncbi:MAG: tRNA lysidine(34) synthetase TilS [Lachnospiraceae bacterium]|nr:tRNA lysidine(34) synthetase TilS [Lachnospiraceae bacterium]
MLEQVRREINQYDMLRLGDRVIAAVSGGADSVCLLSVLHALAPELSVSLRVVHVHHGLRGAEADRDEAYVKELCERLAVPFTGIHRDVSGYAKAHNLSTEEAGRILRYEALEAEAERWEAEEVAGGQQPRPVWIAVAHHQEDNAETILHHLLRGSGLRGLSGIRAVQGRRIRPLLDVSREEILAYLKEQNISWCEDSTNQSEDYTRNRIRTQILPVLKEQVNTRAEENILRAGRIFAQADAYLEAQAGRVWEKAGSGQEGVAAEIALEAFLQQEEIIQTYLLRRMLDLAAPHQKDVTARHYAQLTALSAGPVGGQMNLPGGVRAVVGYTALRLEQGRAVQELAQETGCADEKNFHMQVFPREKEAEIPKNQYTKWFDYDKIKVSLSVRSRQEGDYLMLPDGQRKMIARYMIDEKIPREERERILLLAEGHHVLWVVGYRISEYYKITNDTKAILQVTFDGGENHGR